MSYKGPERRKKVRIPCNFVAYYTFPGDTQNATNMSLIKNMSLCGVLLSLDREIPIDTGLALRIKLPCERNPVVLKGKVRSMREVLKGLSYDAGVEFIGLDDRQKEIVQRMVDFYFNKRR